MIELGQKVRDVVTGFEGIADCRMEFLNGCVRVSVQPAMKPDKEDGRQYVQESKVFDEQQLEILEAKPIALPAHATRAPRKGMAPRTGGDRPDPRQQVDPR